MNNQSADDFVDLYKEPEIYDLLCSRLGGESFFVRLALELGGPFLELACGTGRIVAAVATSGVPCQGLDSSQQMIDYATRRHADLNILFHTLDMTNFALPQRFRSIALAANSIQHLLDLDEWRKVFLCARLHLESGAEFIISLVNPSPLMLQDVDGKNAVVMRYRHPHTLGSVSIMHSFRYNPETQIGETIWTHNHEDGSCVMRNIFQLRYSSPDEVLAIANACGFDCKSSYGGFDLAPLTPNSPLQIHRFSRL